ncbi:zinc ABC transporter substrate-binding protein [uncultured Roseibium sp.]|uniref:metal ABC transporter solute-binding protein, Zn/Mn family n=1 Tax=uncultured Roseibium sp. TaxID=1936171 RepID=UPI0026169446|nr:zinc ABC transporter substrate-binding protein [uncultured Roseibium sp.]
MTSRRTVLKSATALVALSLFAPTAAWADGQTPVVASFSVLGDMVERIGGEHVKVTTLVGPDGDAHVYQPTPKDARAVSEAEVLIVNGLEFEGWLERLSEAADFKGTLVVATTGVDAIPFGDHDDDDHDDHGDDHAEAEHDHDNHDHEKHAEAEHDHEDHEKHAEAGHDDHDHDKHEEHAEAEHDHDDHDHEKHASHDDHDHDKHEEHAGHDEHDDHEEHAGHGHEGHDHGAFDPHAWQSLDNAVIYVDNITAALAKADPDHAGAFYANREAYVAEIEALEAEIDALMEALPENRRTVVTSHDAFGYFADHYGLTFEAPQGLSTESEPSAADVAKLITQIREDGISAVFVESITDNRLLEQISNETEATIGGTLYSDALSGSDGPAGTYLDMMHHNAKTLSEALGS